VNAASAILATRVFSARDQTQFATFSGDWNPIHMDPVAARRTHPGSQVVHGVHLLLWMMEAVSVHRPGLPPFVTVTGAFEQFVCVGDTVSVLLRRLDAAGFIAEIAAHGSRAAVASVKFGRSYPPCPPQDAVPLQVPPCAPLRLTEAVPLAFEDMSRQQGGLALASPPDLATALFPRLCQHWSAARVAALACTSALVGMACPGLHSIYSKVAVTACAGGDLDDGVLSFAVKLADSRFRSVQMHVRAPGLTGTVSAIARMPPVSQLTMAEVACHLAEAEFATVRSLIIGGSRGLGEVTAKIVAAGGGQVFITYNRGLEDALRVQSEIRAAGGICEIGHYDALAPVDVQLDAKTLNVTQLYYFATPHISRPKHGQYDAERFAEFAEFYVNGLYRLCIAAWEASPEGLAVFYPSSEFVAERPSGMTEYAMAKAAGEVLCAQLSREVPGLRVISSRLPRLLTDQTASFLSSDIAEPLETLLPLVRSLGR